MRVEMLGDESSRTEFGRTEWRVSAGTRWVSVVHWHHHHERRGGWYSVMWRDSEGVSRCVDVSDVDFNSALVAARRVLSALRRGARC